jgi:cellobiose phosphorylase
MNAVLIRNVYNTNFSHITAFLSSTLPLTNFTIDLILFKTIEVEIDLKPHEETDFSFMLGTEIGNENVANLIKKYDTNSKIEKEFENVKNYWKNKLSTLKIKTPDETFNTITNGWYLYQTIASRINAKAGFYQVGGAYGFRDQLQDSTNVCFVEPELTRRQIIENARHQFAEGDVLHWWHELIRLGLRSRYKDDYLWLVYATTKYITITGDYKILDEQIEFVDGQKLADNQAELGINYVYSNSKKSLYHHCMLAIDKTFNSLGENGLPLMGGGDWNDGMNKVGIEGKGTSVWLGFFAYIIVKNFLPIAKKYFDLDTKNYDNKLKDLKNSLNQNAWDGDYYLRAFFDNGDSLGSSLNEECKIDLLSQSFSILSGVIDKSRINSVIRSVEENLVDKNLNIIKLLTPAFKNSTNNPGYIMDYPVGIRENGGQYTHSVSWYIMALIKLGAKDKAYEYYQMINPINRTLTKKDVQKYCVEPYVIAADIYSNPDNPGRGGWTWYTGSAGWFYNIAITEILGLKKEGNTLKFKPSVPTSWKSFEVDYKYMDTLYKIKINLNSKNDGILVDGDKINRNYITLKNDKRIHAVIVNGGFND